MQEHSEPLLDDPFDCDRAIQSEAEDKFGTAKFARDLAVAMRRRTSIESLVIALHGPWGSGKSSIKNMCLDILEKDVSTAPLILHFNPWLFSGQDKIFLSFFNGLATLIGEEKIDGSIELAENLRAQGRALASAPELVSVATGITATIVALSHGVDPAVSAVTGKTIGDYLKGLIKGGTPYILAKKEKQAIDSKEASLRSTEQRKNDLKTQLDARLVKKGKPIWVVIDDIDRLTPGEMMQIFQVVKTMADFPGVHYLLLFDRSVVDQNLTKVLKAPSRQFLQKIVQVELDIPTMDHRKLVSYLNERLSILLERIARKPEFDEPRWKHICTNGLMLYFGTPRNIHRYLNSVSFYIEMLTDEQTLEVNPVDLFGLEALRVFEPTLYNQLYSAKHLLAPEDYMKVFHKADAAIKAEAQSFVNALKSEYSPSSTKHLSAILFDLFPYLAAASGATKYNEERSDKLFRDLRAAHPNHFNRYFRFGRSLDELSTVEIICIREALETGDGLGSILSDLNAKGLLLDGLSCMSDHLRVVTVKDTASTLYDLLNIGESMGDRYTQRIDLYGYTLELLKMIDNVAEREALFTSVLHRSIYVYMPCLIAFWDLNPSTQDPIFSEEYLLELRTNYFPVLKKIAAGERLPEPGNLMTILRLFKTWVEPDEVKSYVSKVIQDNRGLFCILELATLDPFGGPLTSTFSRHKPSVNTDYLRDLGILEMLKERLKSLDMSGLSKEHVDVVELFNKALANKKDDDENSGFLRVN